MRESLNVLFLAAEAEPFVKVGGLGDVAGSLPRAIRQLESRFTSGITPDVRLVLPHHAVIRAAGAEFRTRHVITVTDGSTRSAVEVLETELRGMPVYLLDAPAISSGGSIYSSDSALDRAKYILFSLACVELARSLDWRVDIMHANDWHTALALYALHLGQRRGVFHETATLLTIHNLPFMGPDMEKDMARHGLEDVQTGLPAWAAHLPLPLGLWAADAIVAVSPSYAREIQTAKFGAGLDSYLRARARSLHGILNGIDTESFNPATDSALEVNYGAPTLERRPANKKALQGQLGLQQDDRVILLGAISRVDPQKGTDLLPAALRRLSDLNWQFVALGTGQPKLEKSLERLQREFPDRVRVEISYDDRLARQIYAGADALLMPSRYEPCGLAQMIAMRYGCLPVVSAVGGLVDTVKDGKTGFLIGAANVARLTAAIRRAEAAYRETALWRTMQALAMAQDFSWESSARRYFELYRNLLSSEHPIAPA